MLDVMLTLQGVAVERCTQTNRLWRAIRIQSQVPSRSREHRDGSWRWERSAASRATIGQAQPFNLHIPIGRDRADEGEVNAWNRGEGDIHGG